MSQVPVVKYGPSLPNFGRKLGSGAIERVVVLVGAGLSVPCGLPDFRSEGSGLYSCLRETYGLDKPESVFDLDQFHRDPRPFYAVARELLPNSVLPSLAHHFLAMLDDLRILERVYTQNIDTLERLAGIPPEKLVEAHGSFGSSTCLKCGNQSSLEYLRGCLFSNKTDPGQANAKNKAGGVDESQPGSARYFSMKQGESPLASAGAQSAWKRHVEDVVVPKCQIPGCGGTIKPNITFFGEALPSRFSELAGADCSSADLLLVLGTSLRVYPVADVPLRVSDEIPRLLVNKDLVFRQKHTVKELRAMSPQALRSELEHQRLVDPDSDSDSDSGSESEQGSSSAAPTAGVAARVHAICEAQAAADPGQLTVGSAQVGSAAGLAFDDLSDQDKLQLIGHQGGFLADHPENKRDAFFRGTCDDGVVALCEAAGWLHLLRDQVLSWATLRDQEHGQHLMTADDQIAADLQGERPSGPQAGMSVRPPQLPIQPNAIRASTAPDGTISLGEAATANDGSGTDISDKLSSSALAQSLPKSSFESLMAGLRRVHSSSLDSSSRRGAPSTQTTACHDESNTTVSAQLDLGNGETPSAQAVGQEGTVQSGERPSAQHAAIHKAISKGAQSRSTESAPNDSVGSIRDLVILGAAAGSERRAQASRQMQKVGMDVLAQAEADLEGW